MTVISLTQSHKVFLNYRGEQLRYSFVSHLIDAFERTKINFFVDKYEQRGKDLKNLFVRIEESRIALAIFSTRYAESSWCMDELVTMKKLADEEKLQVIPIFYNVKAREVKNQTGEFGDNFWTLAKCSSGDQIKKWKEALECVSDKMGLSLRAESSEADFIKEIIREVMKVIASIRCKKGEEDCDVNIFGNKIKVSNCKCSYQLPVFKRSKIKKVVNY
ncbi:LOW QUALITY PROTEIN: protein PHLOEM PROTEIN 2-LIKE A5 [Capsella rubella]|uniref:LOW QUALITY PROTEIN: protein PHLOEM PROTEIN 2-LIKE A5 n=1 Tax=Capsella rubella TaxID=81985 RepID=UPI000CD4B318|nr:LOW QUALITY PROTEIN: protein PHLOEM PROTEIN 2-LIKE A5 [Capsella rubella]